MPSERSAKCRVDADMYEGPGAAAQSWFKALPDIMSGEDIVGQNYEHTLFCVKKGRVWNVYQTAIVTSMDLRTGGRRHVHVAAGTPVHLGVFED